jgi:hypothetical protein
MGTSKAEVVRLLGAPASEEGAPNTIPSGSVLWSYPIRAFAPVAGLVPAAILRIEIDAAGHVSDWYFLDAHGRNRLPIRETLSAARRFLASVCHQPVSEVDLETAIRPGRTLKSDIIQLLTPVAEWSMTKEPYLHETTSTAGRTVLDYFVDRPSPVFIPPFYQKITIGPSGYVSLAYPEGYGGCL